MPKISSLGINYIKKNWFIGFIDAKGCFFFVNIRPNIKNNGYWASTGFSLVQHSKDILLFKLLKEFLGAGFIIEETNKDVIRLIKESLSFILEIITPLFNNNPLQSSKFKDYLSSCSVYQLIKNKVHLTKEGMVNIKCLKSNMNTDITC